MEVECTASKVRELTSVSVCRLMYGLLIASCGVSPIRSELENSATTTWQRIQCIIKLERRPLVCGSLWRIKLPQQPVSLLRNSEMTLQRISIFINSEPCGVYISLEVVFLPVLILTLWSLGFGGILRSPRYRILGDNEGFLEVVPLLGNKLLGWSFSWNPLGYLVYARLGGGTEKVDVSLSEKVKEISEVVNCESGVAGVMGVVGVAGVLGVVKPWRFSGSVQSEESNSESIGIRGRSIGLDWQISSVSEVIRI